MSQQSTFLFVLVRIVVCKELITPPHTVPCDPLSMTSSRLPLLSFTRFPKRPQREGSVPVPERSEPTQAFMGGCGSPPRQPARPAPAPWTRMTRSGEGTACSWWASGSRPETEGRLGPICRRGVVDVRVAPAPLLRATKTLHLEARGD